MEEIITNSEKETFEFGEKIAKSLKGGEVIGLIGNLGAGKTIVSKGIAKGLGVKQTVNSPTFTIMKVYPIPNSKIPNSKFVHIDAYRLKSADELTAIGALEYFNRPDTIVVIEWSDKVKKILTNNTKKIKIKINDNKRTIIKY